MAKKSDPQTEAQEAQDAQDAPAPGLVELPAGPEKEALREELRRLRAAPAARQPTGPEAAPSGVPGHELTAGKGPFWRVELTHAPTHVVEAADAANAWQRYKEEMGVLTSEFQAQATSATREQWLEAQAKRFGSAEAIAGLRGELAKR